MDLREKLTDELVRLIMTMPLYQRESVRLFQKYMADKTAENLGTYMKQLAATSAKQELMEFLADILEPTED